MVSSKGKPTDPKLREEVKDKIKDQPNKDGSGKGQWAAWKATKLSKEYEAEGGGYENEAGSKNEPKKGAPEPKSEKEKKEETVGDDDEPSKEGKKVESNKESEQSKKKSEGAKKRAAPKEAREGTRKSERTGGTKRKAVGGDKEVKPAPAKKSKKSRG